MADNSEIETIIKRNQDIAPQHTFRRVGESALRIGYMRADTLLGWISRLSVQEFVSKLALAPDMTKQVAIIMQTKGKPVTDLTTLLEPTDLTGDELSGSSIVIENRETNTKLVYDPYEPEDYGYAEVAVLASSSAGALSELSRFLPEEARAALSNIKF